MSVGSQEFEQIVNSWELNIKRGIKPDLSFMSDAHPEIRNIVDRAIEPAPSNRHNNAYDLFCELLALYNSLSGVTSEKIIRLRCEHGKEIYIQKGITTIGRNMIDPPVCFISDKHFELDFDGNSAKIRDVGSTNGTLLNGQLIGNNWVNISNDDVIQIADFQIELEISA